MFMLCTQFLKNGSFTRNATENEVVCPVIHCKSGVVLIIRRKFAESVVLRPRCEF